jgi:hypothetical protein
MKTKGLAGKVFKASGLAVGIAAVRLIELGMAPLKKWAVSS